MILTFRGGDTHPTCTVPAPGPCGGCLGLGVVPGDVRSETVCPVCGGEPVPVEWELLPVRSYKFRRAAWDAATNTITVRKAKGRRVEAEAYRVRGVGTTEGRAWEVCKDSDARVYHVALDAKWKPGWSCDCDAGSFRTSQTANRKTAEAGGEEMPTRGCVHADAIADLLAAGWFDHA